MDDEAQPKRSSGFGRILWLLVIAAIVFIWWRYRDPEQTKTDQIKATDAEAQAAVDPDDVLIDLKDDATPDHDRGDRKADRLETRARRFDRSAADQALSRARDG
ncbi:MAG: hypothetical protein QM831_18805 [Kofleriaceae bacterium]